MRGKRLYAFDLDDTLVHSGTLEKPEPPRPNHAVVLAARRLILRRDEVVVVTGRPMSQVDEMMGILRSLFPDEWHRIGMHMPAEFPGLDKLAWWKAGVLGALNPELFVGNDGIDDEAARLSFTPYADAGTFKVVRYNGVERVHLVLRRRKRRIRGVI